MRVAKTSLHLDADVTDTLKAMYPDLTISEIVRFSLEFVAEKHPALRLAKLVDNPRGD